MSTVQSVLYWVSQAPQLMQLFIYTFPFRQCRSCPTLPELLAPLCGQDGSFEVIIGAICVCASQASTWGHLNV